MDARDRQKLGSVGDAGTRLGLIAIASLLAITACDIQAQGQPPTAISSSDADSSHIDVRLPLIAATLAGDAAAVGSLLDAGTDPNTVYHTNTALTYAARDGHTDIARVLIDAGADVNWIDGEGVTPLILAAFKGHEELTKLLLAHDADTTVVDQWGRTALDYARRRGENDAIAQLIQAAQ
ncbi:MAG: ankyrin repeat domain-containing protein [Cyanobacteria bacterium P01_H01_bin.162]